MTGGLAAPALDPGGRLLLMDVALKSVADQLKVYARPSRKPQFLTRLAATVDECKSSAISPEKLWEVARETGGETGDKFSDLALICGAYEALTLRQGADPRDRLTRLTAALAECRWAEGRDIYLDGFTDFTPQERGVLEELVKQAGSVTVALTCDGLDGGDEDVFAPARRTARQLLALARRCGTAAEARVLTRQAGCGREALERVEAHLFDPVLPAFPGRPEGLELYPGLRALRRGGADGGRAGPAGAGGGIPLAGAGGHCPEHGDLRPAHRFDLPRGMGSRCFWPGWTMCCKSRCWPWSPPLWTPWRETTAMRTCSAISRPAWPDSPRMRPTGWRTMSSSGTFGGAAGARGKPGISIRRATACPWTDRDRTRTEELDALRRRVSGPLEQLRGAKEHTGAGLALALYRFQEEIGLAQRLAARGEELRQSGEAALAAEYRAALGYPLRGAGAVQRPSGGDSHGVG